MPLSIDALNALTKKKWIPELVDQFFNTTPFLNQLRERSKTWDGGPQIIVPLEYDEMLNVGSFSGYDAITRDTGEKVTAAAFDPKFNIAPVTLAKTSLAVNQGPQKVIDYAKSRVQNAMKTLRKKMTTQLFSNGTGNSGKDITGLLAAVSATGTYGGIDRTTYTWWRANVLANGGQLRPLSTRLMRNAFTVASDGDEQPNLILTTDALWNQYAEIAGATATVYTSTQQKMIDLGFQVLNFMGASVVHDKACPAGHMFFLNLDYLVLYVVKGWDFETTEWREAEGTPSLICEILWGGNLICTQPRRQALLKDLDESNFTLA